MVKGFTNAGYEKQYKDKDKEQYYITYKQLREIMLISSENKKLMKLLDKIELKQRLA